MSESGGWVLESGNSVQNFRSWICGFLVSGRAWFVRRVRIFSPVTDMAE